MHPRQVEESEQSSQKGMKSAQLRQSSTTLIDPSWHDEQDADEVHDSQLLIESAQSVQVAPVG